MIKHIVMWNFKEEYSNKEEIIANMKSGLEGLVGKVPGLIDAVVVVNPIDTSTHDIALVTTLESKEALVNYAGHEDHVYAAKTYVGPFVCDRAALDYEM